MICEPQLTTSTTLENEMIRRYWSGLRSRHRRCSRRLSRYLVAAGDWLSRERDDSKELFALLRLAQSD